MTFRVTNNGLHVADPEFTFLDSQLISKEDISEEVAGYIMGGARRIGHSYYNSLYQILYNNVENIIERNRNEAHSN